ncbi:MAG: InlB B-repeat-containing protein [Eggerthellaceae bacterium]|nr:InlB B-repeat-containing protein [Eggerthellaceae bacterium]
MAITYGNTVHHWAAGIDVKVADKSGSANTKSVVTVSVYWHAYSWYYDYYGNGYAQIGTHTKAKTNTVFDSRSNPTIDKLVQTYSYEYDKTTSAQSITCKAVCQMTGDGTGVRNGTSTASRVVTIPARPSYSVKYSSNKPSEASGSVSGLPSNQTKWYDTTLALSKTVPTLASYGFKGWNTSANGSGKSYSPGASYTSNAALTLYAQWKLTSSEPDVPQPSKPAQQSSVKPIMLKDDTGALWPTWASKTSLHQVRWRRRDRTYGSMTMGDWSSWTAWGGDGSNEGWGSDPTMQTAEAFNVVGDVFTVSGNGVPVDLTGTIDRTEIEWGVRAIDTSQPAVGGPYGFVTAVVREFKIVSVVANKTQRGVHFSFTTTYPESSVASATVESLDKSFTRSSSDGGCDIFVGNASFSYLPDIGDQIDVLLTATTSDGFTCTWGGTVVVDLGGFYGEAPTVTCTVSGTLAVVSATAPTGMSITGAWLVVPRGHGDRYVELTGSQPWLVMPPLGVPWRVLVTANAANRWGFDSTIRDAIVEDPPSYHVTSQDGRHDLVMKYRKTEPGVSFIPSYTRSRSETETYSRERPVYAYSDVTRGQLPLIADLVDGEGLDEADWVAHASHVYVRGPHGFWAQCAVDSVRMDISSPESQEVQVNLSEEVW